MGFSWRAAPIRETVNRWPEHHPVSVARSESLFALFGLDLAGRTPMRRDLEQSAFNGTRFAGDLGPLQTFTRVFGSGNVARLAPKSLPSAEGNSVQTSSVLGSIGSTVG